MHSVCPFTLFEQKDIADVVKELSEEASEDSSDNLSDTRNAENNTSGSSKEGSRGRWKRRGTSLYYLTYNSSLSCLQSRSCNSRQVSANASHGYVDLADEQVLSNTKDNILV